MKSIAFGSIQIRVARPTVDAWRALAAVFEAHRYNIRPSDIESYNDRTITSGTDRSLHSYGIAVDFNWTTNPYRDTPDMSPIRFSAKETQAERAEDVIRDLADTDMTRDMIIDALAIGTNNGKQVFEWGGNWTDRKQPMHFEIAVAPEDLATGINRGRKSDNYSSSVGGVQSNFRKVHALIEKWGGGLTRDPSVPSNRGITQNELTLWRNEPASADDLLNLTHDDALKIYFKVYWNAIRGNDLPLPAAEVVYTAAVSSGLKPAIQLLLEVLQKQDRRVLIDGDIGVQTIGVCQSADQRILVEEYCKAYETYLKAQPGFNERGPIWQSRLGEVKQTALEMADPVHSITEAERIIQDRTKERGGKPHELRNNEALELIADELTRVRAEVKMLRYCYEHR